MTSFFIKRRRKAVIKAGLNNQAATKKLTKEELLQLNQVWGKIMPCELLQNTEIGRRENNPFWPSNRLNIDR